jgi:hypothetical protein
MVGVVAEGLGAGTTAAGTTTWLSEIQTPSHRPPPPPSPPQGNVFTFLQQHGGRLPEAVAVPMVLEPTMSALAYIHGLGMIHRDVKPENILLTTSMQIKLADFGLSIHSNYEVANTRHGGVTGRRAWGRGLELASRPCCVPFVPLVVVYMCVSACRGGWGVSGDAIQGVKLLAGGPARPGRLRRPNSAR